MTQLQVVSERDLATGSDGRLSATQFFPDFSFRSPVMYRIRNLSEDGRFLVGSNLQDGTDWVELDSNTFRRVQFRPVQSRGIDNFISYFSTPSLSNSIKNSVMIATISTIVTVTLAFWFAYALNRSCMRFKGVFRLIAMAPILVPVAAARHRAGLSVRQSGHAQGADVRRQYLWPDRHRHRLGVLHLSARLPDHLHRPRDLGCAAVRGRHLAARHPLAHLLDRHHSRRTLRSGLGGLRGVQSGDHRLWPAQSNRRAIQRARRRHLQTSHRPAEFRNGRRGLSGLGDTSASGLCRRPSGAKQTGRPVVRPLGPLSSPARTQKPTVCSLPIPA